MKVTLIFRALFVLPLGGGMVQIMLSWIDLLNISPAFCLVSRSLATADCVGNAVSQ